MKRAISFFCMIFIVLLTSFAVYAQNVDDGSSASEYGGLFDTGYVHRIDIVLSEDDWNDLLSHPTDKTKYEADVVIDGSPVGQVSIATKGNSSLYMVAADEASSRYSFKINFEKYVKKQTYYGLDKLNLQNLFHDATMMKDFLSYELFRRIGVPSPLASYVWVTVNGNALGLYLAVEEVEKGYLDRVFGGMGTLYKPENEGVALDEERLRQIAAGAGAAGDSAQGADLVYTDDQPEHYPDIFEQAVTKDDPETQARVIAALKMLSVQENLEDYLDTEEIIRYFAVHNYLVNFDSYTGAMLHNYFLYEHDGKLSMLPWDYNLIFGAFPADGQINHENDDSFVVNLGIDTPLVSAAEGERPMWTWIPSDPAYLEAYHDALAELISEQFESGKILEETDRIYEMILPYVEKDPTAFYSSEEFTTAYDTLRAAALLRAESIKRQLSGELSTVTDLQSEADRVDVSAIRLRDMRP